MKFEFECRDNMLFKVYEEYDLKAISVFIDNGSASITFDIKLCGITYQNIFPHSFEFGKPNILNDAKKLCIDTHTIGYVYRIGDVVSITTNVEDVLIYGCEELKSSLLFSGIMDK